MDFPRTLVVLHYHLRPAGVRRVIETALPAIIRAARPHLRRVVVLTGEASPDGWEERLREACGLEPEFRVGKSLNYHPRFVSSPVRQQRLARLIGPDALVWAHNLSVGRNFGLLADLPAACEQAGARLLLHHHDWWFDNRWERVEKRDFARLARLTFPRGSNILHATLTRRECHPLARFLPTLWLPNPVQMAPAASRPDGGWFMPCRVLRRKNILEALLLKSWIAPQSPLRVMGLASSPVEADYHARIAALGQVEFGAGFKPDGPLAVTSLLEGFGLPFLETAAAGRPFIGRYLANASPDLRRAGCSLPLLYREIRMSRDWFDFAAETARQRSLWKQWRSALPAAARRLALPPRFSGKGASFSRLTLTAQLEVISSRPAWESAAKGNPVLEKAVESGELPAASLTEGARDFFSAETYAQRFWKGVGARRISPSRDGAFAAMLQQKMAADNLYPLLMAEIT
ncbi:MAG TPA: hypothetical protein VIS74_05310 [Chthoniobacterales bacterium]